MNKFEPTPGEWVSEKRIMGGWQQFAILTPDGRQQIATVYEMLKDGEGLSNSKIIKSSSTMYQKLKDTVRRIEREEIDGVWFLQDICKDLTETIRKIEEG